MIATLRSTRTFRWLTVFAAMALVPLAGACGGTAPLPPNSPQAGQPYRIGPPDQLQITILPEPEIQRTVTVRPDGMISIDLVGDIPAAGRTAEQIAADIQQRIRRYKRDAVVTVALAQALSPEITVLGEVNRPSTFPLSRETRVIEAIGIVGGPRQFASKGHVRVIRFEDGQTHVYRVDLSDIEDGDLSTNMLLQGGDVVIVPPTTIARVGYFMQQIFFPFSILFGAGAKVSTTVMTGGAAGAIVP
jgi:polysaccharide export outer membrane protein